MTKINLLFITKDFRHHLEKTSYYLTQELSHLTQLQVWHSEGHIQDILSQIHPQPDFILFNDMKYTHCPSITGLSSLNIPYGVFFHDIHYKPKLRKKFIEENKVNHIFSHYRDEFHRRFPEYMNRMKWFPHFAYTEIFKDYGNHKDIEWLMMGRISKYYPLRNKILETMRKKSGFVYHKHPGYHDFNGKENNIFIAEKYAAEINRAKIFLTCDSIFHYPLRKYFEVPACSTLLLAPDSKELRDLGFIPYVHFVPIDENDFEEKANYYLVQNKEREEIAKQGCDFINQNHSAKARVKQLLGMIEKIL